MKQRSRQFNLVEFLERWSKIAALIAAIVSALLFVSRSFIESIALITVGWMLILSWLIGIVRKRSTPSSIKRRAYFGMLALTAAFLIWTSLGTREEVKKYVFPEGAVSLPSAKYAGISIYLESVDIGEGRLLIHSLDRAKLVQEIDQNWLGKPVGFPWTSLSLMRLYVKGEGEDQVQIESKIPIRLVSFSPSVITRDVVMRPKGGLGGANAWIFFLEMPEQMQVGTVYKATPRVNINAFEEELVASGDWQFLPPEVQRLISNHSSQPLPDIFTLDPNEQILFSVATTLNKPGVYELQPGIEYIYKGKKSIAWIEPTMTIEIPIDYYSWQVLGERDGKLIVRVFEHCQFKDTGYKCENIPISKPSLEAANLTRFSVEHKTVNGIDEYIIMQNIPQNIPGQLTVSWSPTHEACALRSEEGVYLFNLAALSSFKFLELPEIEVTLFSHNGEFLASGARDGTVKLWKIPEGKLLYELKPHLLRVSALAFSPDDSLIASASEDTTLHISRVVDGELLYSLIANVESDPMVGSRVEEIGFSPDQQIIFTKDGLGITSMWSLMNGEPLANANDILYSESEPRYLGDLKFSPDNRFVAIKVQESGQYHLELWNLQNGSLVFDTPASLASPMLMFSNDGMRLASDYGFGDEYALIVYEVPSGKELVKLNLPSFGLQDVSSFAFSPDGSLFAIVDWDDTLLMLKGTDYSQLYSLKTGFRVDRLAFSQDGETLILEGRLRKELRNALSGSLIKVIDAKVP